MMVEWQVNPEHTLYAVFLTLDSDKDLVIGAKGMCHFPKGHYVYIGSAKKNIESRVQRHYKIDKTKRWHLDYLRPACTITKIQSYEHREGECSLAAAFAQEGQIWIKQFGSSDCKCGGHLIHLFDK